jgi:hypothetical protein
MCPPPRRRLSNSTLAGGGRTELCEITPPVWATIRRREGRREAIRWGEVGRVEAIGGHRLDGYQTAMRRV